MTQKDEEREAARQAALDALAVNRFTDTAVNDIARMAADLCGTSVAMVERHYSHAADERLEDMYLNFMKSQG